MFPTSDDDIEHDKRIGHQPSCSWPLLPGHQIGNSPFSAAKAALQDGCFELVRAPGPLLLSIDSLKPNHNFTGTVRSGLRYDDVSMTNAVAGTNACLNLSESRIIKSPVGTCVFQLWVVLDQFPWGLAVTRHSRRVGSKVQQADDIF